LAKANGIAYAALLQLRDDVIHIMKDMPAWQNEDVETLAEIPLGVLRRNATQRHGVTRWKRGANLNTLTVFDVEVIDLHPSLLLDEWKAYAAFVLHHEYIHALGWRAHDSIFRALESSWPGTINVLDGPNFTDSLRLANAKWLWICKTCDKSYPRQKRGNRNYKCRHCSTILIDQRVQPE
jgi:predicted SprT family Zn-dependent metalloprotease|tara:strand:- start:3143 stop:3682 length:540 start_codon:yes stop_codon:yes gene_type:complete